MPTTPAQCPNYDINSRQCPCPNLDCERHAICCECTSSHASKGKPTRCMSGEERPPATRTLPIGRTRECANRKRNEAACPCGETSCPRHGLCCDCIRYHWGNSMWPKVACLG